MNPLTTEADRNHRLRRAAGKAAVRLSRQCGDVVSWPEIRKGFEFEGEGVLFANKAVGIFKPRQLTDGAALSLRTSAPSRSGREAIYDDAPFADGVFKYKLQGTAPNNHYNRQLKDAWKRHLPLIYFFGVADALYTVLYPVFIDRIDTERMEAIVVAGEEREVGSEAARVDEVDLVKQYRTHLAKGRIHQAVFRQRVLSAYGERCALTGLPVPKLLDAAHIIPDTEEHSRPIVSNGICMSKIHHAAFDSNLIGIDPDGVVYVNRELIRLTDGPLLEICLKRLEGTRISPPKNLLWAPGKEFLAERYESYLRAVS